MIYELVVRGTDQPVVQVVHEASSEILYTVRSATPEFTPEVYAAGKYTIKIGKDKPDSGEMKGVEAEAL